MTKSHSQHVHVLSLFVWLFSIVMYIYAQNNLYSCILGFLFVFHLSKYHPILRFKDLIFSWLWITSMLSIFYGLFLHQGNTILFKIPGDLPLLSGVVTLNAVVYGIFMGSNVLIAMYVFSMLSIFLKNRNVHFYLPGIWSNVSILFSFLSHYVAFFLQQKETFQAKIKLRNLELGKIQKVKLFFHDSVFHAMENSFSFAQVLEMRGFSHSERIVTSTQRLMSRLTLWIPAMMMLLLIYVRIYSRYFYLTFVIALAYILYLLFREMKKMSRAASTYKYSMSWMDFMILIWGFSFLGFSIRYSIRNHSYLMYDDIYAFIRLDPTPHLLFLVNFAVILLMFRNQNAEA